MLSSQSAGGLLVGDNGPAGELDDSEVDEDGLLEASEVAASEASSLLTPS